MQLKQAALRSYKKMNIRSEAEASCAWQVLLVAVAVAAVSAQQFGGIGGGLGGGYHGQSGRSYAVFSGPVEGHVQPIRGTVADQHGKHVEFEDYIWSEICYGTVSAAQQSADIHIETKQRTLH
ncbi:Protein of unknown function [Gryllus bimaculatus]|nr:Protein of unknown function [Gryllus bimaculatus]